MTEDYKENLIKYLTGNIEMGTGEDTPQFIDRGSVEKNVYKYLTDNLADEVIISGTLQQNDSDYILIYGYYEDNYNNIYYGFIYITDKNLNTVSLITEYDSGVKFRPFMTLNFDEEGYMYGVDNKNELYDDLTPDSYRFIMLNKVIQSGNLTGQFIVKLRQSYFFPDNIIQQNIEFGLKGDNRSLKKEGSADYFFITLSSQGTSVISLTINVGESNNWTITSNNSMYAYHRFSCLKKYDSQNNLSLLIGANSVASQSDNYIEATYNFGDTPTFQTTLTIPVPNNTASFMGACRMSESLSYVSYEWRDNSNDVLVIYKINYNASNFETLYTFTEPYNYLGSSIAMYNQNGLLIFKYGYYGANEGDFNYPWKSKLGVIYNNQVYLMDLIKSNMGNVGILNVLYINQVYNLITIYSPLQGTTTQKVQLIFNQNNYNGLPYENTNCLNPNSAILYNDNGNIIFARNLYNKTILGAATTSTVQIPNTMLNDVTISENDLISETNLSLTKDTTDITKNVYETLNINFANSISIRNDNDPNNPILNPIAAVRLNGATTQNNNYDDVKATKVKVNYTDGTNIVITLNPEMQILALTDTTYQYNFILHISKEVDNLQIISFDENTVYQTIDTLNLEVDKTYNILQEVEVQ